MKKQNRMKWFSIAASALLGLLIAAGIVVYVNLPVIVRTYIRGASVDMAPNSYRVILTLLYCVGVPVLALLGMALLLTINISRGQAFVKQNTVCLNLISLCALIIGLMFLAAMFSLNSIFPIIIFVVFLLLAILTKVFAGLFKTAIQYKEENELTI